MRETADGYLRDGHFDYESIATCVSTVEKKWERLMKLAEQRRAVVFTSYNFYRASEQVGTATCLLFLSFSSFYFNQKL